MSTALHKDELAIDEHLVRGLIDDQFPEYRQLTIDPLAASGSSNRLFRLGDELLVRLPRQSGGSEGIKKEFQFLPAFARRLSVPIPEFVALGQPARSYPENWGIVKWIDGELARPWDRQAPSQNQTRFALQLAGLVQDLRDMPVTPTAASDACLRWYRGRPLSEYDHFMQRSIDACRRIKQFPLDLNKVSAIWMQSLQLEGAIEVGTDHWYHADLVAENLLTANGELCGVLDFGCLSVGDPTIDLHGAWELLKPDAREQFRAALAIGDAEWLRGRAWALAIAMGAFAYYWRSMPGRCADRLAMARAVLVDEYPEQ